MAVKIEERHEKDCRSRDGARCNCKRSYRARPYFKQTGRLDSGWRKNRGEVETWLADITLARRRGTLTKPTAMTVAMAAEEWIAGVKAGTIRKRGGQPYKPAVARGYEWQLRRFWMPPPRGNLRLNELTHVDVQDLVDELIAEETRGAAAVHLAVTPMRTIYQRLIRRGEVAVNPCLNLDLPAIDGSRDRVVAPAEATRFIEVLPARDRAFWAVAFYAGLRRGELQALRWEDIDLHAGALRVAHGWDRKEGLIDPKSAAGKRTVPIPATLRRFLLEHKIACGWGDGFILGRDAEHPWEAATPLGRAKGIWETAGLDPVTPHDCRHTYISWLVDAGISELLIAEYAGHRRVGTTARYTHPMPGHLKDSAEKLERYLTRVEDERAHLRGVQ